MEYDVIIVGAGPAGIFASYELMEKRPGLKVLLLEKGRNIEGRNCPMGRGTSCSDCNPCSITSGFGGAGAFSDGKLTLTSEFGGVLDEYIGKNEVVNLIRYIDDVYVRFGAITEVHGRDGEKIKELSKKAAAADLKFIPAEIKHLGTEKCYEILKNMQAYLKDRVELKTSCCVNNIIVKDGRVTGVSTDRGDFYGRFVMVAPGRNGAGWFRDQCEKLGLTTRNNAVDIGVRVEVPAEIMEDITDAVYESKLVYYTKSFDDRVRTFCMNPYGEVVEENVDGLKTVNGHSYRDKKTSNTNFALLVSKEFTEPFHEPIDYGKYIARLANMLGEGVIVQRLGDLLDGRRSTPERIKRGLLEPTLKAAVPGDLSLVLPYRHLTDIIEMLQALDKIAPGIYSKHTLLYGVEVKFYSSRVNLTEGLETEIENLYAAGDGAGVSRGLAQASASGVLVARQILERMVG
ncbi:NAD(P)/FAD-dependent oxidoreductase [Calorimonas adulescens]|jgi:Thi4 family.|uniref:NAD(P)/FAD-dependent oxidoreductase n=1 Tax=Calorimonas adulescens TaxID=2606906 RepID=A0A5D8Q8Q2_9THEO|nr:NAD(P)/FAD-dependent oxidoreductase [Calorimonas adulescens]TZE80862.1 NAD(P)/FAD-dependent oxidoreductase [Calorimonas adulescens]